jgi:Tol biopolymer transport system component
MVDICTVIISTRQVKQITHSGKYKSYNPSWDPDGKHIVYYLEKGDHHDQIYLTDTNGSFHRNITNDTSTLNYYPSWMDSKTILYTIDPIKLHISIDGSNRQVLAELTTDRATYNSVSHRIAYIDNSKGNKVVIYAPERKIKTIIADNTMLIGLL